MMSALIVANITDPYTAGGVLHPGADKTGASDSSAAVNYWIAHQPGWVFVPAGAYKIAANVAFSLSGVRLIGEGEGASVFVIDDSLNGPVGDVFTLTNVSRCGMLGIGIDALSGRTAGWTIRVTGGDSRYQLPGYGISLGGHVFSVDMNNQFNHALVEDSGANGDWGTVFAGLGERKSQWRNAQAGGVGVRLNTRHGASQRIRGVFLSAQTPGNPGRAIEFLATGDLGISDVQTFGWTNSLAIVPTGPANDSVTEIQVTDCQFDSVSGDNVLVNIATGVASPISVDMQNNWIATTLSGSGTHDGIHVTGPNGTASLQLVVRGGRITNHSGWGVDVDNGSGTSRVVVDADVQFAFPFGNSLGATRFV